MAKIEDLSLGISIKRCEECEYKNRDDIRDDLLVTAGVRAGCMDYTETIKLPPGLEGEADVANYISREVDYYLAQENRESFDEFIEESLLARYGIEPEESNV